MQASATWRIKNAYVLAEGIAKSKVFVNDANGAAAPGFAVFNARVGGRAAFGRPWLSPVLGVQNLFDKHYVGSVAVNAAGATIAATKLAGVSATEFDAVATIGERPVASIVGNVISEAPPTIDEMIPPTNPTAASNPIVAASITVALLQGSIATSTSSGCRTRTRSAGVMPTR